MRKILLLALASVLLVGIAVTPAVAGNMLPFHTKADLVSATDPAPDPFCGDPEQGFLRRDEVFKGKGTHIGRFESFDTLCLNVSGFPIVTFEVHGKIIAANDDELTYHEVGSANVETGEFTSEGIQFTGGSGRFTSAEGSAETTFVRDAAGNTVGLRFDGMISYNASDRAG